MRIEIPPTGGIVPEAVTNFGGPLVLPMTYTARIKVVGVYTESGYGHGEETYTIENEVWRGEIKHETEEQAVAFAVETLAEMLKGLLK